MTISIRVDEITLNDGDVVVVKLPPFVDTTYVRITSDGKLTVQKGSASWEVDIDGLFAVIKPVEIAHTEPEQDPRDEYRPWDE